ncbi:MAG: hypothetical protein AB7G06_02300 [Bdellovibrionales bacterium]
MTDEEFLDKAEEARQKALKADPGHKWQIANIFTYTALGLATGGTGFFVLAGLNGALALSYAAAKKLSASPTAKAAGAWIKKKLPRQLQFLTKPGTSNFVISLLNWVGVGIAAPIAAPLLAGALTPTALAAAAVIVGNVSYNICNMVTIANSQAGEALLEQMAGDSVRGETWRQNINRINAPFFAAVGDISLLGSSIPSTFLQQAIFAAGAGITLYATNESRKELGRPAAVRRNLKENCKKLGIGSFIKGVASLNPLMIASGWVYRLGYRDMAAQEEFNWYRNQGTVRGFNLSLQNKCNAG